MAGDFMSAQEIYENFVNGRGPGGLIQAAMHLSKVEDTYNARARQIETLAASMEEGWTGDAGGAAQRGAGPLAVEHAGAAEAMSTAKELLTDQATQWSDTKSRVQPVPPVPAEPSTFKQLITFGSANRDYESQVRRSNEAAQSNVDAMTTWTGASAVNGRTMPSSYGQIDPGTLDVGMTQPATPPSVRGRSTGTDTGTGRRTAGGNDRGGTTGPSTTTPGTTTGTTTTTSSGGDQPGDATGTTGFVPPSLRPGGTGGAGTFPGSGNLNGDGGTGDGFGPGLGIGGGFAGGSGGSDGSATGGGRFGGGAGAGGGAGSGAGTGAGNQAGSRVLGGGSGSGAGTSGEPMGRGAGMARAGVAGRPGAAGTGGMPHGGKGGEKDEDQEHQRKYVLDDDEHFMLGEDGERVTDPRTGLPPVPPVIGET